jgi:hypothetical protein
MVSQMSFLISQDLIDGYSAGPSQTRRAAVRKLHEAIRDALGTTVYDTFLQGSYRNDTAIADINDVDIVALRKETVSPQSAGLWEYDFDAIVRALRPRWTVEKGDKCVRVAGPINADVVPAARTGTDWRVDPIAIYSRRAPAERPNYPRDHYRNGVIKQSVTEDAYKATVRLFKRWARQYRTSMTAPSFYIECAVHSVPTSEFNTYLPLSFAGVATKLLTYGSSTYISSVAGDKDILRAAEWKFSDFQGFQSRLGSDLPYVIQAMRATSRSEADRKWKLAFG